MDYVQFYTSRLNRVGVLKLLRSDEFALVAMLNTMKYSNGEHESEIPRHVTLFATSSKYHIFQRASSIRKRLNIMY